MTYPQATVRGFIRAYNERFDATVILTSHVTNRPRTC
jgi:ABC-type uncharacterized transport system ATPase subunit